MGVLMTVILSVTTIIMFIALFFLALLITQR